jgi:hypothetical protein
MGRIAAKYVSECWEPKSRESLVRNHWLQCAESIADFSVNIITGDETWIYGYNPETKSRSSVEKSPSYQRPKKARQVRSKTKVMLTFFFNQDGVVHHTYRLWDNSWVHAEITIWGYRFPIIYIFVQCQGYKKHDIESITPLLISLQTFVTSDGNSRFILVPINM